MKAVRLGESNAKSHLNALVLTIVETASKNSRGCAASSVDRKGARSRRAQMRSSDCEWERGDKRALLIRPSWDGDLNQGGGAGEAHHGVEDIAWQDGHKLLKYKRYALVPR